MRLFIDTNLLLDVLAEREPFYASAARIWSLCETGACEGFVSAISFNNVFLSFAGRGMQPLRVGRWYSCATSSAAWRQTSRS